MAVAFEDQQVSDQMVEERAVMRDDNRASTEPFQCVSSLIQQILRPEIC